MLWLRRVLAAIALLAPLRPQAPEPSYGRDVRPILADRCFRCHGPDANTRQADLRLDEREQAIAERDGRRAIAPTAPDQSELLRRVTAHGDERMPPADSGKPALTAAEVELLRRWIAGGAVYEPHWAFVPPRAAAPPPGPSTNPIDRFLEAELRARGVEPAPPAAADVLCRRVYLTLTGLPPTPDELRSFLADGRPDAYEQLVERLLTVEPYRSRTAEHRALPWLDAARYADTSGIHMDAGRQAWLWRDWLIEALATDQPFDQFVVDQLAGDLLPDASLRQQVATGFLRHHVTTDEGGAIDEEYRVEYAAERTATVGSVFLGLTLGCARCHDHKYDPISQRDYYRLFAFWNSNDEPGLYSQVPDSNRALEPFLAVPTAAQEAQRARLQAELGEQRRALATAATEVAGRIVRWQPATPRSASSSGGATLTIDADGTMVAGGDNPDRDVHTVTLALPGEPQRWLGVSALTSPQLPEGKTGRAPNGNALLRHLAARWRPGKTAAWRPLQWQYAIADTEQKDGDYAVVNLLVDDDRGWAVGAHQGPPKPASAALLATEPFGGPEAELELQLFYDSVHAQHTFGAVRFATGAGDADAFAALGPQPGRLYQCGPFAGDPKRLYEETSGPERGDRLRLDQAFSGKSWKFEPGWRFGKPQNNLPKGQNAVFIGHEVWAAAAQKVSVSIGSDDGFQLFCNGERVGEHVVDRGLTADADRVEFSLRAGANLVVLKVVNTGGDGGFALRYLEEGQQLHGALRTALLPGAASTAAGPPAAMPATGATPATGTPATDRYAAFAALAARVAAVEASLQELEAAVPRTMVMREAATMRPTHVLRRGDYDKPGEPVERGLPTIFGELPAEAPKNRLGFARWLVQPDQPLLRRVAMNRLFAFVFGQGLVRTTEDFGLQGEWPSHPELLDWLALEFHRAGDRTLPMLRLLVTSAAFRRGSARPPQAAAADPDNRLLAWFPRRRLPAEGIRDQALYAGGLLVERIGGPSARPWQPEGLWQEVAMLQSNTRVYKPDTDDGRFRRSLYTYWKRACPPPAMLAFDAPTREVCTIRRPPTNTPLQALVLWNDPQFLAAARGLAERTLAALPNGDDDRRLQAMFERCTAQPLPPALLAKGRTTLAALRQRLQRSPADADALVENPLLPPATRPAAELAPWLLLANAWLSLDATLTLD